MLSRYVLGWVTLRIFGEIKLEGLFYSYNSIVMFPASVCLFLAFLRMKIKNPRMSRLAIFLGRGCFGVYLASDHNVIRVPLWSWIGLPKLAQSGLWASLIGAFAAVAAIFIVGCLLENLRAKAMTKLGLDRALRRLDDAWPPLIGRFIAKCCGDSEKSNS